LASAYEQLGQSDKASSILNALEDEFDMDSNALHQALMGDHSGALEVLRTVENNRWKTYYGPGKYYEIINDPAWAETIKQQGFQELLAEWKEEVDLQRAIVETADGEFDFRAEITDQ
jgi:hypothetical protein